MAALLAADGGSYTPRNEFDRLVSYAKRNPVERIDKRCETPMGERAVRNANVTPRFPKRSDEFKLPSGAYLFTGDETTQAPWKDLVARPASKQIGSISAQVLQPSPRLQRGLKPHEIKQKDGSPRSREPAIFDLGIGVDWITSNANAYTSPEEGSASRNPSRCTEANRRRISPAIYQSVFERDRMSTPRAMALTGLKPLDSGRRPSPRSQLRKAADRGNSKVGSLAMSRKEARAQLKEIESGIALERFHHQLAVERLLVPHLASPREDDLGPPRLDDSQSAHLDLPD